jgi:ceroid-lipofuscinosis MFS transporter 7
VRLGRSHSAALSETSVQATHYFTRKDMLSSKNSALLSLALIGLVDAISYMMVAPSLIFYVQACGGTKEQYGFILSAFSFASFCAKPVLGYWTDASGNQFRLPYLTSIFAAMVGGLLYFYASVYANNIDGDASSVALGLILAGRVLGGLGAANSALGFAYLATVIPQEEQTQVNSLLSMTRIIGMAAGPGFNVLLKNINTRWIVGGTTFVVDPLNSVGLFLAISNLIGFLVILFLLQDPGPKAKKSLHGDDEEDEGDIEGTRLDFICDILSIEILLPIFTIFVINSNFQGMSFIFFC